MEISILISYIYDFTRFAVLRLLFGGFGEKSRLRPSVVVLRCPAAALMISGVLRGRLRRWFASWTAHVERVAAMAEENRAEMLCVGCEMIGTEDREQDWRKLIRRARSICPGSLMTYNTDKYQEDHVSWWDAVDLISSSGYYPVHDIPAQFDRIRRTAEQAGKPFVFMECGCPSRGGSEHRPNDWRFGRGTSTEAQRVWYQAFIDGIRKNPFVRGTGWWDWPATRLYPEYAGADDDGYCTFGKPANQLIRAFSEEIRGSSRE